MPDLNIECRDCDATFLWSEGEQGFYHQRGFQQPSRCKRCRPVRRQFFGPVGSEKPKVLPISIDNRAPGKIVYDGGDWFIDQERIQEFVDAVEAKKGFKPHYEKIFRHMVSELGELEGAIWNFESKGKSNFPIGCELIDIISLCVYMATVMQIELNIIFPQRMKAIAEQYGVTV